ncbi:GtrA family protein [Nocardioides psychrotolerans]|uniref:GtrA family protein n=1 Tax=Nocardioides psychrotolerans TaxID=1005945 RepID=UPI0031381414
MQSEAGTTWPRRLAPSLEVPTFLLVGGAGYVVDVVTFNVLRGQTALADYHPTVSKVLAVAAAMVVTYLGNYLLTWRGRNSAHRGRQVALFVAFNVIGLAISLAALVVSHDVLGLTSRLADNISANVIGLGLGTAFRYWSYRRFVFTDAGPPPDHRARPDSRRVAGGSGVTSILVEPQPPPLQPPPQAGRGPWLRSCVSRCEHPATVVVIAAVGALVWLPNFARPLGSDESGFLLVASQWSPGTSLYGDYWVDRPPLLIGLFELADVGGGANALHLLGLLAVITSVLLAGQIGRVAVPEVRHAPALVAATAAVFTTTPLFGATDVNGELLAVPFVLASVLSLLCALRATSSPGVPTRLRWSWWALTGGTAMAAPLVKQNMLGGFVVAAAAIIWLIVRRRRRDAHGAAAAFALSAGAVLAATLAWAALRGTGPLELWDAVVVFRFDAAAVIATQANSATPARAITLATSLLASGALVLVALAFLPGRRLLRPPMHTASDHARPDLRVLAATLLSWEAVAIGFGGSYWLHYLLQLLPGFVLTTVAVTAHRPARAKWAAAALAYATAAALILTASAALGEDPVPDDVAVARYLAARQQPGDTGVVAFGNPAILESAGLTSPYPHLWSLPVRVLDPDLSQFTDVLTGPEPPTWAVVNGTTLATWGVDTSRAQLVFDRLYQLVRLEGDYRVYHLRRLVEAIDPPISADGPRRAYSDITSVPARWDIAARGFLSSSHERATP